MQPASCNLCAAACAAAWLRPAAKYATGRSTQSMRAGRKIFYVCVRTIAFMFINTQHASEIAGNSIALLVEIERKLKYVQRGAACGQV